MVDLRAGAFTGLGLARGRGPFHGSQRWHEARWLRLSALPAVEVAGGVVGATSITLAPGELYRARLVLSGLARLASKARLISEFQKLGFAGVQAWDSPGQLPADWPISERAAAPSGKTWWAEGRYQGERRELDPGALDDVQFVWIAEVKQAAPAPAAPAASLRPGARPDHDLWALQVIDKAWTDLHGRHPSQAERLFTAAMARGESYYGMGYGAAKNWGSIHAKGAPPCGPGSIPWTDTHQDGTPYPVCMRAYATDEEGAADLIRQITTKRPRTWAAMAAAKPLEQIAAELRAERYYEASVPQYTKMLRNNLNVILKSSGLADPFGAGGTVSPAPPSAPSSGAAPLLLFGGVAAFLLIRR